MGYFQESTIKRFIGEVGDTKPALGRQADGSDIEANDLPIGSSLMEIDRVNRRLTIYRWTGKDWITSAGEAELTSILESIYLELVEIKELVGAL